MSGWRALRFPGSEGKSFPRVILAQFASYLGVGAIGTAAHYSLLIVVVQKLGFWPVVGSTVGFTVGAVVNYSLNYYITFRSQKRHYEGASKFFLVALSGLVLNTIIFVFVSRVLSLHYLLAQIAATGVVTMWTFTCNRLWTFGEIGGWER